MAQKCARRLRKAMRVDFFCFVKKEKIGLSGTSLRAKRSNPEASRVAFWIAASPTAPRNDDAGAVTALTENARGSSGLRAKGRGRTCY